MKILYFDIDGTILAQKHGKAKSALRNGALEEAIRGAHFRRLVCVSSAVRTVQFLRDIGRAADGLELVHSLCDTAFQDQAWLGNHLTLVKDPEHRVRYIDTRSNWWYMDDLAAHFCSREARDDLFQAESGKRILVPSANGDGAEVLEWIR